MRPISRSNIAHLCDSDEKIPLPEALLYLTYLSTLNHISLACHAFLCAEFEGNYMATYDFEGPFWGSMPAACRGYPPM